MKRQSLKVRTAEPDFKAVYKLVDQRSEGRCEIWIAGSRCARRGVEHHHLVKPRRANHHPTLVVHVCREHHDRMEWPYQRGRLVYLGAHMIGSELRAFYFGIRYGSHKFTVYQPQAGP